MAQFVLEELLTLIERLDLKSNEIKLTNKKGENYNKEDREEVLKYLDRAIVNQDSNESDRLFTTFQSSFDKFIKYINVNNIIGEGFFTMLGSLMGNTISSNEPKNTFTVLKTLNNNRSNILCEIITKFANAYKNTDLKTNSIVFAEGDGSESLANLKSALDKFKKENDDDKMYSAITSYALFSATKLYVKLGDHWKLLKQNMAALSDIEAPSKSGKKTIMERLGQQRQNKNAAIMKNHAEQMAKLEKLLGNRTKLNEQQSKHQGTQPKSSQETETPPPSPPPPLPQGNKKPPLASASNPLIPEYPANVTTNFVNPFVNPIRQAEPELIFGCIASVGGEEFIENDDVMSRNNMRDIYDKGRSAIEKYYKQNPLISPEAMAIATNTCEQKKFQEFGMVGAYNYNDKQDPITPAIISIVATKGAAQISSVNISAVEDGKRQIYIYNLKNKKVYKKTINGLDLVGENEYKDIFIIRENIVENINNKGVKHVDKLSASTSHGYSR